jgi:hypothetical protein
VLRRLEIESTPAGGSPLVLNAGGTADRLYVRSTGTVSACQLLGASGVILVRDSTCYASGTGDAVSFELSGVGTFTARLRNVTAVATNAAAYGIDVQAANGATVTMDATNVIASGGTTDVRAQTGGSMSPTAAVDLVNSNYATADDGMGSASLTSPGTGTNQTAPPVFVDAAAGDFRQAASSPTIDMGTAAATLLGSLDIDGDPRSADGNCDGAATPDIGADELVVACPPAPTEPGPPSGDSSPPDTTIHAGPKRRTRRTIAEFEFSSTEPGSSFDCVLDGRQQFKACASPFIVKVGKGKHTFDVRATDAAGNADATPASTTWKVKRKRKK